MPYSRRIFIKNSLVILAGLSACRKGTTGLEKSYDTSESILDLKFDKKISLTSTSRLVFFGDSITDAKRNRTVKAPNTPRGMGNGFVNQLAATLLADERYTTMQIFNRGYGGATAEVLADNLGTDLIPMAPDVVSILIGANDLHNEYPPQYYYMWYKNMITRIQEALPNVELILCEPFILPNVDNYDRIRDNFHEYRKVIRTLARDFKTAFIPYNEYFQSEAQNMPYTDLLLDGIHPAAEGISILKTKWLSWVG